MLVWAGLRRYLRGRHGIAALVVIALCWTTAGAALADNEVPAPDIDQPFVLVAPKGQIILNPDPDFTSPSPVWQTLNALEPGAGIPVDASSDGGAQTCDDRHEWQVLVIRGGQSPAVVRGTGALVVQPNC